MVDLVLDYLNSIYNNLSAAEKKVAKYILERPDDVIHYSITEFAQIVGVSEATIHRLVRKLSFDGYQSFKISLTRETTQVSLILPAESNPLLDYISEMSGLIEKLKKTLTIGQIEVVAQKILEARKIIFFGVGLSSVTAEYGSLLFSLLGLPAFSYSDPHTQVIVATGLSDEDLVVSISHSGNIRDIVKSTQVARDVGAFTIAITAGVDSPITRAANMILLSPVTRFEKHEFLQSNLGEMAVIEILFRTILNQTYEKKADYLEEVSKVLKPKNYENNR
ncbi:MAG TPA: MurR/RpiR family transcriptional regulator [Fervidobacterium sp.]|nr:MurR/RpiR family transcriptional regulator [Fervidobacterium sp.]HPT53964.1 MurR/RpiR family transcriptional regulator [Fervidobacterium sp.]HPZ17254.1 MurR/RpiR family transcriptional regulator [Fervidobacterium sp.]HQE48326.1 MurR/RpiR family transcriptional regulator [Fervidobacterium sp.]HRD20446.1 MurR/RpiR family transcriptional regulator [Fervidobacterium sp.]